MAKKSSQPKPPGARQTYTSTVSQPSLSETVLSAFSEDSKFFALVTLAVDKHRLRIFNGISGRASAEYTIPSGRVSSLVWSTCSLDADTDQTSPSKKRKKRRAEDAEGIDRGSPETVIVALGMSDGSILLFSPSHSKVVRTLSHGSSASAIIALTPSSFSKSHLWSSSADSSIQLWDVQGAAILKAWKNDDRISYTSLALEPSLDGNEPNLLVAHHHIRLLTELSLSSPTKPKQLASFTGHASPIKILRWIQSPGSARQFCSAAEGDRYIYLWDAQGALSNEKATASVLLDSDVRTIGIDSSDRSRTTLMALSSSGCLSFIPIPADLPSQRSSSENITNIHTLLPRSTLRNGKKGKSYPSVIDFTSIPSNFGSVRVVRLVNGIKPVFDVVRYLDDNGKYEQNLGLEEISDLLVDDVPQLISSKRYKEPPSLEFGSGLDPDQTNKNPDSLTQREIDGSLEADTAELSLGQRLAAVAENDADASSGSDIQEPEYANPKKSKSKAAKALIPSNSLTRTLIQALHSSDSRLLEMCLAHADSNLIRNTVRRLPPQLAIPLINACVERLGRGARGANMKGRGGGASSQRAMGLVTWINTVLAVHTGHLMTIPDVVARLSGLYTTLNQRLSLHESLVSLSGRLDTVLSQVESRAAVAPSLTVNKAAKEKKSVVVERYVEGESDSEEDTEMDDEVEVERLEDEGSVEDIELGRESGSESESEDDSEGMNEFIDDEAEEDEDEYTDEDDDSE